MKTIYFHPEHVKDYIINNLANGNKTTQQEMELIQIIQKYQNKPLLFESQDSYNNTITFKIYQNSKKYTLPLSCFST